MVSVGYHGRGPRWTPAGELDGAPRVVLPTQARAGEQGSRGSWRDWRHVCMRPGEGGGAPASGGGGARADGLGSNGDRPGRERNVRWVSHGRDFRFPLFPRPALIMFLQEGCVALDQMDGSDFVNKQTSW
jgi:hypothetical protein